MMTSPAQAWFVRSSLQIFGKFMLFLSGYSFQLCSFENTLMTLSQVYTLKVRLEGKISQPDKHT